MSAPILIMAGGTGGHVFPALAVAAALRERNEQVVWLGTERGLEAQLVPAAGIPLEFIRVSGLRGKGAMTWVAAPFRVAVALIDALGVLRRRRPKVVLGMGGFASGPGGFAAWLLRRPLVIHEQNSVAGLTNRLLAGMAREVLEAFPGAFSGRKTTCVGNPVRQSVVDLPEPRERFAGRNGPLRLLVLGGSQGALALNQTVPQALALIAADQRPEVIHQAGRSTVDVARAAYRSAGVSARVESFIDDMARMYGWADLVICRSGALTVSELAAAGLGAILIPFPAAVDDHQTTNGEFLAREGAAIIMQQRDLTADALALEIRRCIDDRSLVLERARRARKLASPDATRIVADRCQAWASEGGKS